MDSKYQIKVSIPTPEGLLAMGNFFAGEDKGLAQAIFDRLLGTGGQGMLRMDLLEQTQRASAPRKLRSRSCSLDQYLENCRLITCEVFKKFSLERNTPATAYHNRTGEAGAFRAPLAWPPAESHAMG